MLYRQEGWMLVLQEKYPMQTSRKSLLKTLPKMKGGEKVSESQARLKIIYKNNEHLYITVIK